MNVESVSQSEIIAQVTTVLDKLGPFPPKTPRKDMWRTTELLTYELMQLGLKVDLDSVDEALGQYESVYRERLKNGRQPEAAIRRATYPDRTTALHLWGSTKYHGQPWLGQAPAERLDSPEAIPSAPGVSETAPRVFLSHAHRDGDLAGRLASAMAIMGVHAWMFETHIEYRGPIAKCVRAAIKDSACCLGLLSRTSIASLWVLTELHTALECKKPVVLVVDAADELLLDLLRSVRFQNGNDFFGLAVRYDEEIVGKLHEDYCKREAEGRANRYPGQVRDFLATLPAYLAGRAALAFPDVPQNWSGSFAVSRLETLSERLRSAESEMSR